jgi:hypothetical protein
MKCMPYQPEKEDIRVSWRQSIVHCNRLFAFSFRQHGTHLQESDQTSALMDGTGPKKELYPGLDLRQASVLLVRQRLEDLRRHVDLRSVLAPTL